MNTQAFIRSPPHAGSALLLLLPGRDVLSSHPEAERLAGHDAQMGGQA